MNANRFNQRTVIQHVKYQNPENWTSKYFFIRTPYKIRQRLYLTVGPRNRNVCVTTAFNPIHRVSIARGEGGGNKTTVFSYKYND